MKASSSPSDVLDPDPVGEHRVQSPTKLVRSPTSGQVHGGHLAGGVDASIGPTRSDHGPTSARESLQRRFELSLDGAVFFLDLPSVEAGPVVVECELKADSIP